MSETPGAARFMIPSDQSERCSEENPKTTSQSEDTFPKEKDQEDEGKDTPKDLDTADIQPQSSDGPQSGMPVQEGMDFGEMQRLHPYSRKAILMRAVADYVQSVEEDLDGINSTLRQEKHSKSGRNEGSSTASGPKPSRDANVVTIPWLSVILETKFYPCDGLFGSEGEFWPACDKEMISSQPPPTFGTRPPMPRHPALPPLPPYGNMPHPNHFTYTCQSEHPYLIRVLYDSTLSQQDPGLSTGARPNADAVELIGFTVTSRPIAEFFDDRLGLDAGSSYILKFGRPFRSVIRNMQLLRDQLSSLTEKYDSETAEVSTYDDPRGPSDKRAFEQDASSQQSEDQTPSSPRSEQTQFEQSYDEPGAFEHFKRFLDFVDEYLSPKIELYNALKAGKGEKIAYEDLWMLFDTGDTIYCPSRKNRTVVKKGEGPNSGSNSGSDSDDDDSNFHCTRRRYVAQAYRVLATTGGSLLKKSWAPKDARFKSDLWTSEFLLQLFQGRSARDAVLQSQQADSQPRQKMKERFSPLHVICMYIDFDGVRYGTETDMFVFKPFDGEVSIKSLEAYPLHFAINPRANYLSERGRRFVDITSSSTHMKHAGFTAGENKEEVSLKSSPFTS